ncbi:MAG: hypothetical protein ABUT20_40345 [Bacteroidota bacterium]
MIKILTLVIVASISLFNSPLLAGTKGSIPASCPNRFEVAAKPSAKLLEFKGAISGKKIILKWAVAENETANLFEVQKSLDGKNFEMTALVFGTDKLDTDNYTFYEKANTQKISYRIKLVSKNKETEYSSVIEINASKTN